MRGGSLRVSKRRGSTNILHLKMGILQNLIIALSAFFRSLVDPFYLMEESCDAGVGFISFGGGASKGSFTASSPSGARSSAVRGSGLRVKTLADLPCSTGG